MFAKKPVIAMVHLLPLPGAPLYSGEMRHVIEHALRDAHAIEEGGADAIIFENFGDRPFMKKVGAEAVAAMTRVIAEVAREVRLPFGVNVLRNDGLSALAIAVATGASMIRVNVHVGAMLTDQGLIEGDAAALLRERAALGVDVKILADHLVKHAVPLAPTDPVQLAKDLRSRGLADAIVITGRETGAEADLEQFRLLRDATDAPLLVGSGLNEKNAADFGRIADGAIVGTSIKRNGDVGEPVESDRVKRIVAAFKS